MPDIFFSQARIKTDCVSSYSHGQDMEWGVTRESSTGRGNTAISSSLTRHPPSLQIGLLLANMEFSTQKCPLEEGDSASNDKHQTQQNLIHQHKSIHLQWYRDFWMYLTSYLLFCHQACLYNSQRQVNIFQIQQPDHLVRFSSGSKNQIKRHSTPLLPFTGLGIAFRHTGSGPKCTCHLLAMKGRIGPLL